MRAFLVVIVSQRISNYYLLLNITKRLCIHTNWLRHFYKTIKNIKTLIEFNLHYVQPKYFVQNRNHTEYLLTSNS